MADKMNATVKAQFTALCDQLKAGKAEMQPITAGQVAAVLVRALLIEQASETAADLIPPMWAKVPDEDKEAMLKINREQRASLAALLSPWITAASNTDKLLRKDGFLPERPATNAPPEFA